MMKTYTLFCVKSQNSISFNYDSTDPDIIVIKTGSKRAAVKTSELAEVFVDLDPVLADAIAKDAEIRKKRKNKYAAD